MSKNDTVFFSTIDGYVLRSKVISGLYGAGFRKAADYCKALSAIPDVKPVVRCKDCKYHTAYRCPNDNLHWTHNCTLGNGTDGDDYYCADGERREAKR